MRLELARCTVREYTRDDVDALARHANNRNIARFLRDRFPHPYTRYDALMWIDFVQKQDPCCSWAIDVDGEAVGGIGIMRQEDIHRRQAEIGYWLGEAHWGKGIVTEALRAVTTEVMPRFGLYRLFACVFEGNPASARVLEKAGYAFEGRRRCSVEKDGVMLDELAYVFVVDPR